MGRQVGVIFGTFGAQDRPRSVQNASCKLINIKNVNFHQILRPLVRERKFGAQDGLQNASRSAQDGSKRLLKSNFFALENLLKFGVVLGPILVDFGPPKPSKMNRMQPPLFDLEIVRCSCYVAHRFKRLQEPPKRPQDPPKRLQEAPKSAPGGSKRPPRGSQETPRRPQETPGADQEGSRPTKIAPKGRKRTLSQRRLCRSMLQISQRSTKTKHF